MTGGSQGLWSFPRRRMWRAVASGVFACALGATACGGGQPPARGFGSTQIEPIRDSTLVLEGEGGPGVVIYGTGGPGGGVPASANYWTLNLSTGAVQDYGSQYPAVSLVPSHAAVALHLHGRLLRAGAARPRSRSSTTTPAPRPTSTSSASPSVRAQDGNLVAVVPGPSGFQLSMGPFTQLVPVPLALQIDGVYWWDVDPATDAPNGGDGAGVVALGPRRARRLHRRSRLVCDHRRHSRLYRPALAGPAVRRRPVRCNRRR